IDLAVEFGIVKKAGAWFSCGTEKLGQGRENVKRLLKEDETLRNTIRQQVRDTLTGTPTE
ncbi:MAG TPA: DNA recombination/repair protein RecA, partial [Chlorobaculum parvum]|nr:DNA recombination/repair protein RecA [Chlorobaculum parvum]